MWLRGGLYDDWARFLERWASGDESGMDALPPLDPQLLRADTVERLVNRITDALSTRLQDWADRLTAELSATGDEFAVGRALAQARNGLRAARRLAGHPGLPPELAARLLKLVDDQVTSLQRSLQDQVRREDEFVDPVGVRARRRAVLENPLTAVLAEPTEDRAPHPRDDWFADPTRPTGRRVVLD